MDTGLQEAAESTCLRVTSTPLVPQDLRKDPWEAGGRPEFTLGCVPGESRSQGC